MEGLQFHLHGAHEADCKKSIETFTTGHRNISRLFYKRACDRECTIHSTTY